MLRNPLDHIVSLTRWISNATESYGGFQPDLSLSFAGNISKLVHTMDLVSLYREFAILWLEQEGAHPIYFEHLVLEPHQTLQSALHWLGVEDCSKIPAAILSDNYRINNPKHGLEPYPRRFSPLTPERSDLGEWRNYIDDNTMKALEQKIGACAAAMGYGRTFV